MPQIASVMGALDLNEPYFRAIARGIRRQAFTHGNPVPVITNVRVLLESPQEFRRSVLITSLSESDLPAGIVRNRTVIVTTRERARHAIMVCSDNRAIGVLVAQHFHANAHQHVSFLGLPGFMYSKEREIGFTSASRALAIPVMPSLICGSAPGSRSTNKLTPIIEWLQQLPKPVGIMACNDERARLVHSACTAINLRIPEDVAVVGVDNNELICEFHHPPLSSVDPGGEGVGYKAGEVAWALACGEDVQPRQQRVPPHSVIIRHSSDAMVVDDDLVRDALAIMRQKASQGLTAGALAAELACSRRRLEIRFKTALNRTLHDELQRIRYTHAGDLLTQTALKIPEVAQRISVRSLQHFINTFKRWHGITPGAYRKKQASSDKR